ncbi:hypothetical protein DFH06DRAFT_1318523 [Mycena polygramma]|nr:hypothetical protein DFH06DRAFT_1318523 [Mycena polygramma]
MRVTRTRPARRAEIEEIQESFLDKEAEESGSELTQLSGSDREDEEPDKADDDFVVPDDAPVQYEEKAFKKQTLPDSESEEDLERMAVDDSQYSRGSAVKASTLPEPMNTRSRQLRSSSPIGNPSSSPSPAKKIRIVGPRDAPSTPGHTSPVPSGNLYPELSEPSSSTQVLISTGVPSLSNNPVLNVAPGPSDETPSVAPSIEEPVLPAAASASPSSQQGGSGVPFGGDVAQVVPSVDPATMTQYLNDLFKQHVPQMMSTMLQHLVTIGANPPVVQTTPVGPQSFERTTVASSVPELPVIQPAMIIQTSPPTSDSLLPTKSVDATLSAEGNTLVPSTAPELSPSSADPPPGPSSTAGGLSSKAFGKQRVPSSPTPAQSTSPTAPVAKKIAALLPAFGLSLKVAPSLPIASVPQTSTNNVNTVPLGESNAEDPMALIRAAFRTPKIEQPGPAVPTVKAEVVLDDLEDQKPRYNSAMVCGVTDSALQDKLLVRWYMNLPGLPDDCCIAPQYIPNGVEYPSMDGGMTGGHVWFSFWTTMMDNLDPDTAISAITFDFSAPNFAGLARISPSRLSRRATGPGSMNTRLAVDSQVAICVDVGMSVESAVQEPSFQGLSSTRLRKWIALLHHNQEYERWQSCACVAAGEQTLYTAMVPCPKVSPAFAVMYQSMLGPDTRTSSRNTSSPAVTAPAGMFSPVRSAKTSSSATRPAITSPFRASSGGAGTKYMLRHDETVPVYDARRVKFDFRQDIANVEGILPLFDGEIPNGSFVVVGSTMGFYKASLGSKGEKVANMGCNLLWVITDVQLALIIVFAVPPSSTPPPVPISFSKLLCQLVNLALRTSAIPGVLANPRGGDPES